MPLLGNGLQLRFFDEPAAAGGDEVRRRNHARAPWFVVMEWQKA
jgi:hypothetical protein